MMQALNGSIVALITPMHENGEIDYETLSNLIEWHIEQGTCGIVSVGTTGESATLSVKEHIHVIEKTVNYVEGRIPVIAGTGSNSTAQAIETTMESKRVGADFCMLVTPYYNKPSQAGLIQHYLKIAESVEIPQILYNVPSRTSIDLRPETVEIISQHPNIIGIKEAVNDNQRMKDLINLANSLEKDFSVFSGDDPSFVKLLKLGGHGVISVAANIVPDKISEICSLIMNGDEEKATKMIEKYQDLFELLFIESNPVPAKWMLFKMNMIKNNLRLPLIELDKKLHEKINNEMLKLGLL